MKKETFAGLSHDYSFVSEVFLTAKKVAEIFCCLFRFFVYQDLANSSFSFTFFSEFMRSHSCTGVSKRVLINKYVGFFPLERNMNYYLI